MLYSLCDAGWNIDRIAPLDDDWSESNWFPSAMKMNPLVDSSEYNILAFDEWRWMVHEGSTPLSLTVFGDWIYSHDNAIYLCSPTSNDNFEEVAATDAVTQQIRI
ncbi:MAG: hypothetical protein O3C40_23740 [Planctomycetota bacterium]|nr:hypothetical protein [Planctomycetota bacterium]